MATLRRLVREGERGPGSAPEPGPSVAFVLSGGGNLGAVQVGMLRALLEREVLPDLVIGCSAGALNGAVLAEEPTLAAVDRLEALWMGVDVHAVMPNSRLPTIVQLARKGVAIHENHGLRALIQGVLTARTFAELVLPFECVATAIDEVEERWFADGPLVEPILASGSLPGVFPAVTIDGVRYMDGAVVNDIPISRAVHHRAAVVYVLHVGAFERPRPEPRRPLDVALQAYWIARHHRFKRDLSSLPEGTEAVVLPTGTPPVLRFDDLGHAEELIANAYAATAAFLDQGHPAAHPAGHPAARLPSATRA